MQPNVSPLALRSLISAVVLLAAAVMPSQAAAPPPCTAAAASSGLSFVLALSNCRPSTAPDSSELTVVAQNTSGTWSKTMAFSATGIASKETKSVTVPGPGKYFAVITMVYHHANGYPDSSKTGDSATVVVAPATPPPATPKLVVRPVVEVRARVRRSHR